MFHQPGENTLEGSNHTFGSSDTFFPSLSQLKHGHGERKLFLKLDIPSWIIDTSWNSDHKHCLHFKLRNTSYDISIISSSNFGQTQQHNMSDIVTALGPGRKLDSLSSFAPTYVTACRALDNLLVFPNLDAIKIDDTSESNLLSLGSVGF